MSSTNTLGLRWKRPPEWEKFERAAHDIFPSRDSATGYLVELAWHDFRSDHKAEEIVSRLLEAVGTNSAPEEGKKFSRGLETSVMVEQPFE